MATRFTLKQLANVDPTTLSKENLEIALGAIRDEIKNQNRIRRRLQKENQQAIDIKGALTSKAVEVRAEIALRGVVTSPAVPSPVPIIGSPGSSPE